MSITCLIVDDEPLARNLLTDYVSKVPSLQLLQACASPLAAIEVLRSNPVDLLFLDIQMPEITGISLLRTLQKRPLVVLTTAYSEYALEGYDLDVVDYLLKPVTFERFLRAVEKAGQRLTPTTPPSVQAPRTEPTEQQPFVFVKDGTKLVKVRWADILYVEGLKDYVTIHTRQQKIVTLQRLKTLEEQLPTDKFIRIHHSYIVAVDAIDVVHKGEVQIGNVTLPVSDSYRKQFKDFTDRNQMM
ncbi:LytR/AlgR family response regulator transcription factor [Parachryseolinea silvisoli]|uniref:LytR/AlgR family response regulator transcription factor n=1 Tax=Parachryseolinea silvisoli TaxID=2873601 RepID=UPI002265DFC4|nr:LytTR family DNA-binding domain-containing protein [Parachryseolinea silvisoli]MCD9014766.1 LytTR family DNA-binding domain-containing protein [Parachryseolinea silvisoli]